VVSNCVEDLTRKVVMDGESLGMKHRQKHQRRTCNDRNKIKHFAYWFL